MLPILSGTGVILLAGSGLIPLAGMLVDLPFDLLVNLLVGYLALVGLRFLYEFLVILQARRKLSFRADAPAALHSGLWNTIRLEVQHSDLQRPIRLSLRPDVLPETSVRQSVHNLAIGTSSDPATRIDYEVYAPGRGEFTWHGGYMRLRTPISLLVWQSKFEFEQPLTRSVLPNSWIDRDDEQRAFTRQYFGDTAFGCSRRRRSRIRFVATIRSRG